MGGDGLGGGIEVVACAAKVKTKWRVQRSPVERLEPRHGGLQGRRTRVTARSRPVSLWGRRVEPCAGGLAEGVLPGYSRVSRIQVTTFSLQPTAVG